MSYSESVETARQYYNSDDADRFYSIVWGGEDIHIGLYETPDESIFDASRRTVETMADLVAAKLKRTADGTPARVLDLGAGYGGAARYLYERFGCQVDCLNLSEIQNQRNRDMNKDRGEDFVKNIEVIDGSFEAIPADDDRYDLVWSQDAILHSGERETVLKEVARVLKSGGEFLFTDPMQGDDCPAGVLQPVLDRIHLDTMGSPGYYRATGAACGLNFQSFDERTFQLVNHYSRVRAVIQERYDEITKVCDNDYIDRMIKGLGHWIDAGKADYLAWGILRFTRA
ncbi:MAG: methyltransferase domain-containing protein [bacterium]|nr:methyltransferase domain-containing protein [bacterium]